MDIKIWNGDESHFTDFQPAGMATAKKHIKAHGGVIVCIRGNKVVQLWREYTTGKVECTYSDVLDVDTDKGLTYFISRHVADF